MRGLFSDLQNHKLNYIVNFIVAFLFLVPFLWIVSTSFKKSSDIVKYPPEWIPDNFTFDNYQSIFTLQNGVFLNYFLNSAILTISTVLIVTLVGAFAGYGFSKLNIPFKNIILMLILVTLMIPFHGLLIPLFSIMKGLNLLNTHIALVIIYVTFQLPFAVFMLKNSFDALPNSLREAALIDGYSDIQTFLKIALPLVWPGLATVAIFSAYTTWNDFLIALVFANSNELKTLNVGLTNLAVGQYGTNWGLLSSGSIISFIPIILLFFFLQRYFISGLTSGSVK
ncbi:carbohydrate ABC transporter permease [Mesobacillus foraminis]|uniref:Multiple sugar transport system permease protein n=1 Tax=Mesobacillus foraminis TaxID=279826 RepID=A0A4V2RCI8_9BACI|nr:carbohydrate ABC transporter permease [Mesobacillus foraminis]TCN21160.1 multiple sugar transport system permease protein [Mesobacillus foraminis]